MIKNSEIFDPLLYLSVGLHLSINVFCLYQPAHTQSCLLQGPWVLLDVVKLPRATWKLNVYNVSITVGCQTWDDHCYDGWANKSHCNRQIIAVKICHYISTKEPNDIFDKIYFGVILLTAYLSYFLGGCYLIRQTVSININPQRMLKKDYLVKKQ